MKSGRTRGGRPGLAAFTEIWRPTRSLVVGTDGVPLEDFLARPVEDWLRR